MYFVLGQTAFVNIKLLRMDILPVIQQANCYPSQSIWPCKIFFRIIAYIEYFTIFAIALLHILERLSLCFF